MKNVIKLCGIFVLLLTFSCSNEDTTVIDNPESSGISLKSPNNIVLENSLKTLGERITGKTEGVEISAITYVDLPKDFDGLVAHVNYSENGEDKTVMIIRNIYEIKFEAGTVLQFSKKERTSNSMAAREGDIYISCSGSPCCYPSGTYNPGTGEITTSCKCEDNPQGNSGCIMKISDKEPVLTPGG